MSIAGIQKTFHFLLKVTICPGVRTPKKRRHIGYSWKTSLSFGPSLVATRTAGTFQVSILQMLLHQPMALLHWRMLVKPICRKPQLSKGILLRSSSRSKSPQANSWLCKLKHLVILVGKINNYFGANSPQKLQTDHQIITFSHPLRLLSRSRPPFCRPFCRHGSPFFCRFVGHINCQSLSYMLNCRDGLKTVQIFNWITTAYS